MCRILHHRLPRTSRIAFQPQPGGSVAVGFSESLTAVVSNDSNNYGVDWSLTCQNPPNCGSLTVNGNPASHTASGSPITYTAPATLSTNSTVVEIVALATADQTKNVVAPVTITTFNSSFQAGNYVLQAQGVDSSLEPYQFAAALVLDGNGNITGGEQTANYASNGSLSDANLTGSYFLGNDGRGTITINTNDGNIGVETFAFVYLSTFPGADFADGSGRCSHGRLRHGHHESTNQHRGTHGRLRLRGQWHRGGQSASFGFRRYLEY